MTVPDVVLYTYSKARRRASTTSYILNIFVDVVCQVVSLLKAH